jgi:hypothetical protein
MASITLKNELVEFLENTQGGPCECLMLNGTPMKKIEKSFKLPLMFVLCHLVVYGLLSMFCFPIWRNERLIYSNLAIEVMAISFWLIA